VHAHNIEVSPARRSTRSSRVSVRKRVARQEGGATAKEKREEEREKKHEKKKRKNKDAQGPESAPGGKKTMETWRLSDHMAFTGAQAP